MFETDPRLQKRIKRQVHTVSSLFAGASSPSLSPVWTCVGSWRGGQCAKGCSQGWTHYPGRGPLHLQVDWDVLKRGNRFELKSRFPPCSICPLFDSYILMINLSPFNSSYVCYLPLKSNFPQGHDGWEPVDWEGEPKAPGLLPAPQWTRGDGGARDGHDNDFHHHGNHDALLFSKIFCAGSSLLLLSAHPSTVKTTNNALTSK